MNTIDYKRRKDKDAVEVFRKYIEYMEKTGVPPSIRILHRNKAVRRTAWTLLKKYIEQHGLKTTPVNLEKLTEYLKTHLPPDIVEEFAKTYPIVADKVSNSGLTYTRRGLVAGVLAYILLQKGFEKPVNTASQVLTVTPETTKKYLCITQSIINNKDPKTCIYDEPKPQTSTTTERTEKRKKKNEYYTSISLDDFYYIVDEYF